MGYNVSLIKVDFPLPETPVTQQKVPNGISRSTFFKLFPVAPFNSIFFPLPSLLISGMGILRLLFKKSAVMVLSLRNDLGTP